MIRDIQKKLTRLIYQGNLNNLLEDTLSLVGVGNYGTMDDTGEKNVIRILRTYFKERKVVVFDVGANVGKYSAELLKNFRKIQVYAFEPNKLPFNELSKINSKRLVVNNIALGSSLKKIEMFSFPDLVDTELSSTNKDCVEGLYGKFKNSKVVSFKVNQETLDNYCYNNKICKIDCLKIDVEGYEFEVLKGCKNLLDKNLIEVIQFEFNIHNTINKVFLRDFANILKNYKLYRVLQDGFVDISRYDPKNELFGYQNIIAVRKKSKLNFLINK